MTDLMMLMDLLTAIMTATEKVTMTPKEKLKGIVKDLLMVIVKGYVMGLATRKRMAITKGSVKRMD